MNHLIWIIAVLGLVALIGTFFRMKQGFGPNNLKALGITLVTVFAALLATQKSTALTAGIGLLGSVVGYICGSPKEEEKKEENLTNKPS